MEVSVEVEELTNIDVGFDNGFWLFADVEDCIVELEFLI